MSLQERVLKSLHNKRQRLINGEVNSIPSPFKRFSNDYIGLEQGVFYLLSSYAKGGKSQFASYTFLYTPILYAYNNRDKVRLKIFYYALEEAADRIMERFISFLLFQLDKIRISPRDLRSSRNNAPLSEEILEKLKEPKYQDLIKFFEDTIVFSTVTNPTGIYKECKQYAEENGTTHYKPYKYKDEMGRDVEGQAFDYYEPNDPDEYRLIIIDHLGLLDTERGLTLKQSMDKMSEYCSKYLRNRYKFSPIIIQQQAMEKESAFNVLNNMDFPDPQGLADSKYSSRDCNIMIGLYSPFKFNKPEYKGYDITKFKDHIRFIQVVINRDGESGGICPLFFDGATCTFKELPLPSQKEDLEKVYKYIKDLK